MFQHPSRAAQVPGRVQRKLRLCDYAIPPVSILPFGFLVNCLLNGLQHCGSRAVDRRLDCRLAGAARRVRPSLFLSFIAVTSHELRNCFRSKRYRRSPSYAPLNTSGPSESSSEGVTILRPCRGLDVNLYENLESSFRQEHPQFQIIFSVAAPGDAAIPIIESLMQKYPSVDARLIVGAST